MKLYRKIMLLIITIVFVALISYLPFATLTVAGNIQDKVESNILNIAKTVAKSPSIRMSLEKKDPEGNIKKNVDSIYKDINDVEFIVVTDMNGIRYSHPDERRIGQKFVGGDEKRVIETGEVYISEGTGTLGKSLRAFVPIYSLDNNKQIGFVSVGALKESIIKAKIDAITHIALVAFIGLFTGAIAAVFLTNSIKKSLLGLEPEEISRLYNEKDSMLKAINEGIIAIDRNCNINMINVSALRILQLEGKFREEELIGTPILDVLEGSRLPQVVETGIAEYNDQLIIKDTIVVTNRVPIMNKEEIIGALATFKDRTEITRLAEEVTGVKLIVEALRANTHEFMNKLHVILGLIQIGDIKQAKQYILKTAKNQELISEDIIKKIKDPTIAGLLIGKISRAKELGIEFRIDDNCNLEDSKNRYITNHTLITVIGNLLENAFDAVNKSSSKDKVVYFKILETDTDISITVKDTGIGILESELDKIFKRGYTTKLGSRGIGLDLVKKIVTVLKGDISVDSNIDKGTTFNIILRKSNNEVTL